MIEVENADVDREIAELSRSMGVEETRVRNFFLKNTDTLADIVHRIRMKKTVSRVMEKVSIKEDDISEETSETAKNEEEGS
jgi:FKBP-type peptidyl-prolyl cis-trans isomerase (trigger factor)